MTRRPMAALNRPLVAFLHDVFMAAASVNLALYMRLGPEIATYSLETLALYTVVFTGIAATAFMVTGLYRGIWRYASTNDLVAIVKAVTLAVVVFVPVLFLATRLEQMPRSAFAIQWLALIFMLGGPRFLYRVFKDRGLDHILESSAIPRIPVLVVGTDDSAEQFIRETARDRGARYIVRGMVDVKGGRIGREIHGVKVLGLLDRLEALLAEQKLRRRDIRKLVISADRLEPDELASALEIADRHGMTVARLPRLTELQGGTAHAVDVQPIQIEDLLGRPQTTLDRDAMARLITGRRVLVTGAGGTIGGELCRQIAAAAPEHLILVDSAEFLLYSIDLELGERHAALSRAAYLGDVRDATRMDDIVARERPELVFHAAALKHVPLVEANPNEAVLINTIGTRNVAEACRRHGVALMLMISTDKVVNPTSIMGTTKRLAEAYCQALDAEITPALGDAAQDEAATRFATVRFGNVLGSTGSVVPLFQRQLAAGGPLTVTHPEITRYFMTVREAVELVLQAAALARAAQAGDAAGNDAPKGGIYVLEMGEPVKIVDLAKQLIRLAGLRPEVDVKIEFTGLRPGEKLWEELFHAGEQLQPTTAPGILLARPRHAQRDALYAALATLEDAASTRDSPRTLALLAELVPEMQRDGVVGTPARPPARSSRIASA